MTIYCYKIKAIVVKPWFRKPRLKYQIIEHGQHWVYGHFDSDLRDYARVVATYDDLMTAYTHLGRLNIYKGEK